MRLLAALLLLFLLPLSVRAQRITGVVSDMGGMPISDVAVSNIHTDKGIMTHADGRFDMDVSAGQLVEFKKLGFRTARVRVGTGALPPFYRIILEPGVQELEGVQVRGRFQDYKHDSAYYREYFKKQLDFPTVTGWRAIQSPFTAMSKSNQQMIRFQQQYAWFEEQKYVDYTFSQKLITQLTGLKGDSAQAYIQRFRPSYEALRSMPEYDLFSYIKQTVHIWRERQRLGPNRSIGSGGGG
jgi:hypothetical protein